MPDLIAAPADRRDPARRGGPGRFREPGPALVQQRPGASPCSASLSEQALAKLFPGASRPIVLALSAGLLQIHDFWDASHVAAQEADDLGEARFSAYWHGIAHRREPDAGNAAYWFRRVGRHAHLAGPGRGGQADPRGSWRLRVGLPGCSDRAAGIPWR